MEVDGKTYVHIENNPAYEENVVDEKTPIVDNRESTITYTETTFTEDDDSFTSVLEKVRVPFRKKFFLGHQFAVSVILLEIFGLSSIGCFVVWMTSYHEGLGWDKASKEFNLHVIFMVIGLIFCYGNAAITSYVFKRRTESCVHYLHCIALFLTFIFTVFGIIAGYDVKVPDDVVNVKSFHTWLGMLTLFLFLLQGIISFISLFPKCGMQTRRKYSRIQLWIALVVFTMSTTTCLLGVSEKLELSRNKGIDFRNAMRKESQSRSDGVANEINLANRSDVLLLMNEYDKQKEMEQQNNLSSGDKDLNESQQDSDSTQEDDTHQIRQDASDQENVEDDEAGEVETVEDSNNASNNNSTSIMKRLNGWQYFFHQNFEASSQRHQSFANISKELKHKWRSLTKQERMNFNEDARNHSVETTESCPTCQKTFKNNSRRNAHVKSCGKEWKCSECEKTFLHKRSLDEHYRAKHAPGFKCERCNKCFGNISKLKRHSASHSSKNVKCSACDKCFSRADHLKRHFSTAHGNNTNN